MTTFAEAQGRVQPTDEAAARAADARQALLTKPAGALGRLEGLGSRLAAIARECPPPVPAMPAVAVFAGDHGVLAEGVTPWPAEVTAQMVANFLSGGAAINVFAREVGARVAVVDVGVATAIPPVWPTLGNHLVDANVRLGTGNLAVEPAMTIDEAWRALDVGAAEAADLVADGADCLVTGDMGIGNTTSSAALVAAFTGRPARMVTGRGTGISEIEWEHKASAIERGLDRAASQLAVPVTGLATVAPDRVLAELGGLEIAALAGFITGGAAARVPVIIDGVIALAAALAAVALTPEVGGYLVAGHRSTEPAASVALAHLDLEPLLDLEMRLGEGTGACLAVPLVRAAARVLGEMATFGDAGVVTVEG